MQRIFSGAPGSVAWKANRLGKALGLSDLWIVFSGWHPLRGAHLSSGSFKELEAYAVLARRAPRESGVMVFASAGNTARAMLRVASTYRTPIVAVVPEYALESLADVAPRNPTAKLVAVRAPADYDDATRVARDLAQRPGFFPEGGSRNVARRDGLGSCLLTAFEAAGRLPAHFVQAVGSATGAIGAYEMALRLEASRGDAVRLPRFHLVQNAAFCPIHQA